MLVVAAQKTEAQLANEAQLADFTATLGKDILSLLQVRAAFRNHA